ncbi:MAG: DMT family transporter [Promethearchaeota archaeon]|jgi:drug/metabolite transporter (DMT)-like permease
MLFIINLGTYSKKGLIYGFIGTIFVGLQPIVAISRPEMVNTHISAAMTCLVETLIFLPLMLVELKRTKNDSPEHNGNENSMLKGWINNLWLLLFIGIIFGINQLLFFIGYDLAGPINGALTQKTTVFFSMFLGYLILKEKITKLQIIFSTVLFLGLTIGITQFFTLIQFSISILIGVGILLGISFLWMIGHTLTKPIFDRKEATPVQMVFIRNLLSGIILIITYFLIFPFDYQLFMEITNLLFFFVMGAVYGVGLVCWYKTLSYLDLSKATIIFAPTPIISAIFATFILGVTFTLYHLIGIFLVMIAIVVIMRQKEV